MSVSTFAFLALLGLATFNAWKLLIAGSALLFFLFILPYAVWLDVRWARRRRAAHPDNNFHRLPRLNAKGFDRDGSWKL